MKTRRHFLAGVTYLAALSPLAAQTSVLGQKKIGLLMPYQPDDAVIQARVAAFREALTARGWQIGSSAKFEEHWTGDDLAKIRNASRALVDSRVDLVLTTGSRVMPHIQAATRTIPIIFVGTSDPVGQGFVASLARPGGNTTGFSLLEFDQGRSPHIGKLVEILREIDDGHQHFGMMYNADNPATRIHADTFESLGRTLGFKAELLPVRTIANILETIASFSAKGGTALLMPSDLTLLSWRQELVSTVNAFGLTAVYSDPAFVEIGGLISYSADRDDLFRRAADYVDRILKGESPAELPVQQPTAYQLTVNIKTAKALRIEIPNSILVRADEVIE